MTVFEPAGSLTVSGDARAVHDRAESVLGDALVGAVATADGEVSHIVVDGDLSDSTLDSLKSEFGVAWEKQS